MKTLKEYILNNVEANENIYIYDLDLMTIVEANEVVKYLDSEILAIDRKHKQVIIELYKKEEMQ